MISLAKSKCESNPRSLSPSCTQTTVFLPSMAHWSSFIQNSLTSTPGVSTCVGESELKSPPGHPRAPPPGPTPHWDAVVAVQVFRGVLEHCAFFLKCGMVHRLRVYPASRVSTRSIVALRLTPSFIACCVGPSPDTLTSNHLPGNNARGFESAAATDAHPRHCRLHTCACLHRAPLHHKRGCVCCSAAATHDVKPSAVSVFSKLLAM